MYLSVGRGVLSRMKNTLFNHHAKEHGKASLSCKGFADATVATTTAPMAKGHAWSQNAGARAS